MAKYLVTFLVGVEVDSDSSWRAENQLAITLPSNEKLEEVGKVMRTHWSIELQPEFISTSAVAKPEESV